MPALHLPAAIWGGYVELTGQVCPLTYLENSLRISAGQSGYRQSFIEHYLLAIIYPDGLTRGIQLALAGGVVLANIALYGWVLVRRRAERA